MREGVSGEAPPLMWFPSTMLRANGYQGPFVVSLSNHAGWGCAPVHPTTWMPACAGKTVLGGRPSPFRHSRDDGNPGAAGWCHSDECSEEESKVVYLRRRDFEGINFGFFTPLRMTVGGDIARLPTHHERRYCLSACPPARLPAIMPPLLTDWMGRTYAWNRVS